MSRITSRPSSRRATPSAWSTMRVGRGSKANVESALSMTWDRDASCLKAMETHTGETVDESSMQEG